MASIEITYSIISTNLDGEDGSEVEVDSQSETSDTSDDYENSENVGFYIRLLMNLVPSMEQAYSQILVELGRNERNTLVNTSSKGAVEDSQLPAIIHSEASTDSSREYLNTSSSRATVEKTRNIHDENWAKNIRELFEQIWDEKQDLRKSRLNPLRASSGSRIIPQLSGSQETASLSTSLPSNSKQSRESSPPQRFNESEHIIQRLPPNLSPDKMRAWKPGSFGALLTALSSVPLEWENPGLLDEALQVVPLDRIYAEAEDESQVFQAKAKSLGGASKAECGYQDCVIRALTR